MNNNTLTIVSRESRLAMQQANIVKNQLQTLHPTLNIKILGITTSGDQILDQPLNKIGGKGLFVKELENCLLQGQADIAVHSMKDMPAWLPDGLGIGAILSRVDPRDTLVSLNNYNLQTLPQGAVIGTSSLRRQAQILAVRPDLKIKPLRGNVETRLRFLKEGQFTAIILAVAGLQRLELNTWITSPLDPENMLPAVGQGALGIEYRLADHKIKDLIASLNDQETANCVLAERAMNAKLDGGCQAPIGALAEIKQGKILLRGLVADIDGKTVYAAQQSGSPEHAIEIGESVAAKLCAQGAERIIQDLKKAGLYAT